MASGGIEEIAKLGVSLSLESDSFTKQMTTINRAIKNTEKEFKSAGKGVDGFENTMVGLDAKIKKTTKQIDLYNTKLTQQQREHRELQSTIDTQVNKLNNLETTLGKGSKEWKEQAELVKKNSGALDKLNVDISQTEGELNKLGNELKESVDKFGKLGNETLTIEQKLAKVGRSANLTESEFDRLGSELETSGGYFQRLGNEIEKLANKIDHNRQKIDIYENEINKLGTTLDKNKQDHQQLAQEINQTENELEQAKSAYGQNSTEATQLHNKLLQLKDSYNTLGSEIEQGENDLDGYQIELNQTQREVNELTRELRQIPFDRLGNDLVSSGQKIKGVGQSLMPVSGAILATGVAAGKMSMDFDKSFAKVSTLLDSSTTDFATYKDDVSDAAKEMGVDVNDFCEALYQSISAGVDSGEAIKFTSDMVKLAKGGFTETATAVDLVTTILNSYGDEAGSVDQIMDSLINTQNTGKTTVAELAANYGKLIPIANGAGVQFNQLNGAMATLTAGGISTAESTTYLKSMINELAKSGTKVSDILKNKTGKSFQDLMKDGMPLSEVLSILKKHAESNGLAFNDLFGSSEAATAAMSLMEDGGVTLNEKIKDVTDTTDSANGAFEKMEETTGNKLAKSINDLKIALAEMGDVLAPVIEFLADKISDLADWFTSLDKNAQGNVVTMAGLAMAIGPVLSVVGSLLTLGGNLTLILGGASGSAGLLSSAFAFLAGPVGIGAAILAFAKIADSVGDSEQSILGLQEKFGGFGTFLGGLCEFISGVWDLTMGNLALGLRLVFDVIGAMIDGPGGATVEDAWASHTERVNQLNMDAMAKLSLNTTQGMSQLRNATDAELNNVTSIYDNVLGQIPNITSNKFNEASSAMAGSLAGMSNTELMILQGMNDQTKWMFDGIKEGMNIDQITQQLILNFERGKLGGLTNTKSLEEGVKNGMDLTKQHMDTKTKEGADKVDKNTKDAKNKADTNTKELANKTDTNTKDAANKADTNTKQAANSVKTNLDQSAKDAGKASQNIASEMQKGTSKAATTTDADMQKANKAVQQSATDMYNGSKKSYSKMADVAKTEGSRMYNGVSTSASKMAQSAKSSASDMYRGVTTSTRLMANSAIADWNRVRNAYSRSITGTITKVTLSKGGGKAIKPRIGNITQMDESTRVATTLSEVPQARNFDMINPFFIDKIKGTSLINQNTTRFKGDEETKNILDKLVNLITEIKDDKKPIELKVYLDKKVIIDESTSGIDNNLARNKSRINKIRGGAIVVG